MNTSLYPDRKIPMIVGIDPGLKNLGWAVAQWMPADSKWVVVHADVRDLCSGKKANRVGREERFAQLDLFLENLVRFLHTLNSTFTFIPSIHFQIEGQISMREEGLASFVAGELKSFKAHD